MKLASSLLSLSLLIPCASVSAQSRTVTLAVFNAQTGTIFPTNSLSIGTNEVATISSVVDVAHSAWLQIAKDGFSTEIRGEDAPGKKIAGPATLTWRMSLGSFGGGTGFCTIDIAPESFPPGKTVIIPADTRGANIIMEASNDLIQWTNAAPGIYTNLTGHLFFRIRAERIP